MVRAINQIGHVMNIETIAEGVESIDLLARLGAIGVDYAQGYAIGRPQPFAAGSANARPSAGARGAVEKTQGPAAIL
jgi:EAL domain-containing protein (putative c-di-GMP-specific phosphodiesterase class I)